MEALRLGIAGDWATIWTSSIQGRMTMDVWCTNATHVENLSNEHRPNDYLA